MRAGRELLGRVQRPDVPRAVRRGEPGCVECPPEVLVLPEQLPVPLHRVQHLHKPLRDAKKYPSADTQHYKCPACAGGMPAAVAEAETTARALCDENGVGWLDVLDIVDAIFKHHLTFKSYKAHRAVPFATRTAPALTLTLHAKKVLDAGAVRPQLNARVRCGPVARHTCALFSDELTRCRGCAHRACSPCLRKWYGRAQHAGDAARCNGARVPILPPRAWFLSECARHYR